MDLEYDRIVQETGPQKEKASRRGDRVDVDVVLLARALRQVELEFVAVLERFADDQGVLAVDLSRDRSGRSP